MDVVAIVHYGTVLFMKEALSILSDSYSCYSFISLLSMLMPVNFVTISYFPICVDC